MAFETTRRVEFQHCDPAGLVFYPRYFEWTNSVTEEWFASLGRPFAEMHMGERKGVPTAGLKASFPAPTRLGELLAFRLRCTRPGRSSLPLRIEATCGGEVRLRYRATLVHVDLGTGRPEPWPAALAEAFAGFVEDGTEEERE
ncbi:MAG TPA: thioesterase family protein [Paracoccaceae bacterium]|nr:thioesterase family protein [Paracoccaceae bacterium]